MTGSVCGGGAIIEWLNLRVLKAIPFRFYLLKKIPAQIGRHEKNIGVLNDLKKGLF